MRLTEIINESGILLDLPGESSLEVLSNLVDLLGNVTHIRNKKHLLDQLVEREKLGTTGIGFGIAIPHCKSKEVDTLYLVIGRSNSGVDFDSLDGNPANLFFLLVAPEKATADHLRALAKIARLAKDPKIRESLLKVETNSEFISLIKDKEEVFG